MTGLVHVYTGNGKGKTTSALGLAFRSLGRGYSVYFIQFMKGSRDYGEVKTSESMDNFRIWQFGTEDFVDKENPSAKDIKLAKKGMAKAHEIMDSLPVGGEKVLMVLDELNVALDFCLVSLPEAIGLIMNKPQNLELVITGRNAHENIMEIADYVTEMKEIKHPYMNGIMARKGIEF